MVEANTEDKNEGKKSSQAESVSVYCKYAKQFDSSQVTGTQPVISVDICLE